MLTSLPYDIIIVVMDAKIGDLIRKHREEKGLTLDALAEQASISMDHLGRIERGETENPRADTLVRIARALNVGLQDIVGPEAA